MFIKKLITSFSFAETQPYILLLYVLGYRLRIFEVFRACLDRESRFCIFAECIELARLLHS